VSAEIGIAWHDVVCPEATDCPDRPLHAASHPLYHSGMLERFLHRLDAITRLPFRGSDVEAWLREHRDRCQHYGDRQGYLLLDSMLDDYRLRADMGRALRDDMDSEEVA
jgi:hypothetical protein